MTLSSPSPPRSNCLVWAGRQVWVYGGAFVVRGSYYVRFLFHVAWSPYVGAPANEILGYSPRVPKQWGWDSPWFKGHVSTEENERREFVAQWTDEDRRILRAQAFKGADQVADVRTSIRVYSDYIATLNL